MSRFASSLMSRPRGVGGVAVVALDDRPQSTEMMSTLVPAVMLPGMPCTIMSLGLVQITAGSVGSSEKSTGPSLAMTSAAISLSCHRRHARSYRARVASCISATTLPAFGDLVQFIGRTSSRETPFVDTFHDLVGHVRGLWSP